MAVALVVVLVLVLVLVCNAGLLAQTVPIAPLVGPARVIDGDTIDVAGTRIRLEGIDAPETGQSCGRKYLGSFDCGAAATKLLADMTQGQQVTCTDRGRDKYGRMLAVCFVGTLDLNAEMVRRGMAWAFLKYSRTYVEVEAEARALRIGIWEGDSVPAWIHRAQTWQSAEQLSPAGCVIKGNVSRNGQIYHLPWSPWYGRVTVDERRGERWFCSEAEAMAAGWRPAGSK